MSLGESRSPDQRGSAEADVYELADVGRDVVFGVLIGG